MPITINGSGTLTGVSVGGLPDGIVDADTLATDAVTTVKIEDDAVTDAKENLSGAARAWVNFNGDTGTQGSADVTIRNSFNVSSVTDNGTGDYTVTFTNAMANADYCVSGGGSETAAGTGYRFLGIGCGQDSNFSKTTSAVRVSACIDNSTKTDAPHVYVVIHGD